MSVVSLQRAFEHLRLDTPEDEGSYVESLLAVAEAHVEEYLARPLAPWDPLDPTVPVPAPVQHAILLQLGDLYVNRTAVGEKTLSVNPTLDRLLHFYRRGLGI